MMGLGCSINSNYMTCAGALSCYTASLCFKAWKRSPLMCTWYIVVQMFFATAWATACYEAVKQGYGAVAATWPSWLPTQVTLPFNLATLTLVSWPFQPLLYISGF